MFRKFILCFFLLSSASAEQYGGGPPTPPPADETTGDTYGDESYTCPNCQCTEPGWNDPCPAENQNGEEQKVFDVGSEDDGCTYEALEDLDSAEVYGDGLGVSFDRPYVGWCVEIGEPASTNNYDDLFKCQQYCCKRPSGSADDPSNGNDDGYDGNEDNEAHQLGSGGYYGGSSALSVDASLDHLLGATLDNTKDSSSYDINAALQLHQNAGQTCDEDGDGTKEDDRNWFEFALDSVCAGEIDKDPWYVRWLSSCLLDLVTGLVPGASMILGFVKAIACLLKAVIEIIRQIMQGWNQEEGCGALQDVVKGICAGCAALEDMKQANDNSPINWASCCRTQNPSKPGKSCPPIISNICHWTGGTAAGNQQLSIGACCNELMCIASSAFDGDWGGAGDAVIAMFLKTDGCLHKIIAAIIADRVKQYICCDIIANLGAQLADFIAQVLTSLTPHGIVLKILKALAGCFAYLAKILFSACMKALVELSETTTTCLLGGNSDVDEGCEAGLYVALCGLHKVDLTVKKNCNEDLDFGVEYCAKRVLDEDGNPIVDEYNTYVTIPGTGFTPQPCDCCKDGIQWDCSEGCNRRWLGGKVCKRGRHGGSSPRCRNVEGYLATCRKNGYDCAAIKQEISSRSFKQGNNKCGQKPSQERAQFFEDGCPKWGEDGTIESCGCGVELYTDNNGVPSYPIVQCVRTEPIVPYPAKGKCISAECNGEGGGCDYANDCKRDPANPCKPRMICPDDYDPDLLPWMNAIICLFPEQLCMCGYDGCKCVYQEHWPVDKSTSDDYHPSVMCPHGATGADVGVPVCKPAP